MVRMTSECLRSQFLRYLMDNLVVKKMYKDFSRYGMLDVEGSRKVMRANISILIASVSA